MSCDKQEKRTHEMRLDPLRETESIPVSTITNNTVFTRKRKKFTTRATPQAYEVSRYEKGTNSISVNPLYQRVSVLL